MNRPDAGPYGSPVGFGRFWRALGRLDRRWFISLHTIVLLASGLAAVAMAGAVLTWEAHVAAPWLIVAAMFFGVEATALHIEIRRETHTLSLSSLPLLLGLLSLNPMLLVGARLIGSGFALVFIRRRYGLKLFWNLSLYTLEAGTAALIAAAALADGRPQSAVSWVLLLVAVLVAELIGLISVPVVIMIAENEIRLSLFAQIGRSQLIAAVSATFGIVSAGAVLHQPWLAAFAALPLVAVAWLLRNFGHLGREHHDLQQLHSFTTAIAVRDPVEAGLDQLTTILRASMAAIAIRDSDSSFVIVTNQDSAETERTVAVGPGAAPVVGSDVVALSVATDSTDAAEIVKHLGGQTALALPLRDDTASSGYVLLIDRLGASDEFRRDEVQLFGSLATNLASRISAADLLDRLEVQARTDALTGLANRSAIEAEIERRLDDGNFDSGIVLMLDLDRFKDVNDSLGHQFGDALLQLVADRLKNHLREKDVAGRLGGDEFAIVLDTDDQGDLDRRLASLGQRLTAPAQVQGVTLEISCSIGVTSWPTDSTRCAELLRYADIAMYEAKRTHQTWVRYTPSIDHASADRLALLGQIRQAIDSRELRIHLQPQIRVSDQALLGAEALLRWYHPERGLIPPGDFLPLAEQSALSSPITQHVIKEAIGAIHQLNAVNPNLRIWINLTARDLLDQSLPASIATSILAAGIDPNRLGFEVTESSLIVNTDLAITNLAAIRQLGCQTSIDDFGTGYASLSYLQRLPVDEVKIDQSFVTNMTTNPESAAIVRATTRLIQDLGKAVVVEGVEDQPTLEMVTHIGCDTAQGFYYSRPLDVPDFIDWARTHNARTSSAVDNPSDGLRR